MQQHATRGVRVQHLSDRRSAIVRIMCGAAAASATVAQSASVQLIRSPGGKDEAPGKAWYTAEFVTYLSRVLLNYDDECRSWWFSESNDIEKFEAFSASLAFALRRYDNAEAFLAPLIASNWLADPEAKRHLALALALLSASEQPTQRIEQLLDGYKVISPRGGSVGAVIPYSPALNDYLQADFLALLPRTQVPVKNADGIYEVRGLAPSRAVSSIRIRREYITASTYSLFAAAGALGCCATHALLVPLDVVKTKMQTNPSEYANLLTGVDTLAKKDGWRALTLGFVPTVVGYSYYGGVVYPSYEFFRRMLGDVPGAALLAGALATCLACIGASPAEAVRIRVVADPATYRTPNPLLAVLDVDGFNALYAGFGPLLLRQVMFGAVKFAFFDSFADALFDLNPVLRSDAGSRFAVATLSGLVAGSIASLISHPADALLSRLAQQPDVGQALRALYRDNAFFKGAPERCAWAAAVISGQFALYDLAKSVFNVSPSDLTKVLDVAL